MKKITFFVLTLMASFSFAQGLETFDNVSLSGSAYSDGNFTGQDGSTWNFLQSRGDVDVNDGDQAIMLGRNRTPDAEVVSGTISNGIGILNFDYLQAFSSDVNLEVYVNNTLITTVTSSDQQNVALNSGDITVDVSGDFTLKFFNPDGGQVAIDNVSWTAFSGTATPSVSISAPSDGVELAPGTTSTDLEFAGLNLPNDATFSVTVNGNTTTNATSPFTINTTNGTTYNVTVDVVSGGGSVANDQISFSVGDATQVADIAALRAGAEDGTFYQVTGEAVITYQQGFRNQKYVQDASGAILIDDTAGNISTSYNVGDGLTGLVGTLSSFNGMLQFVPAGDPGAATSTGNTVNPQILTISEFNTNFENYEAELVAFEDVTFTTADGVITFDNGDSYPIEDAGQNTTLVEALFNLEYTGDIVPTNAVNVVGLAGEENNGEYRIYPRDNDIDVTLSNTSFTNSDVVMYPNPVKGSLVSISINNADTFTVEVYNVLGKQVLKQTANNSTQLNTSGLKSGVYLVKITEGNQSLTKKLIVQ